MIIRKKFKFEMAHIVRQCTSERCKKSIHGHSFIVEVLLEGGTLDRGQMIMDFALFKPVIGKILDSFDHSYAFWDREHPEFKEAIKRMSERWVQLSFSPSAESLSLFFVKVFRRVLRMTSFGNGENGVSVNSVIVHETATGYAQAFNFDMAWWNTDLKLIEFSPAVIEDWKDPTLWKDILEKKRVFTNETIELDNNLQ